MEEAKRIDTGGPAFPTEPQNHGYNGAEGTGAQCGMTMRDYFAGQALVGLFSIEANPRVGKDVGPYEHPRDAEFMATYAYDLADAMLKQRNK